MKTGKTFGIVFVVKTESARVRMEKMSIKASFYLLVAVSFFGICVGCAINPLRDADGFFAQGRYGRAILRYEDYLRQHPNGPYAQDAMFRIGDSYYKMGLTLGADKEFRTYLAFYPKGKYAEQSKGILQGLADEKDKAEERVESGRGKLSKEIADLEKKLKEPKSDKAPLHYILAGKYYQIWDYKNSFGHDQEAYKLNPKYGSDSTFRTRVNFTPDGQPYSIALAEQAGTADVIRFQNVDDNITQLFGPRQGDRAYKQYNVSGEATNVFTQAVKNVQVEVVLRRFGGNILASKKVVLGNLNPQDVRTFSVNFNESELGDVYIVYDYKVKALYDPIPPGKQPTK